jgi:hypothetical protein
VESGWQGPRYTIRPGFPEIQLQEGGKHISCLVLSPNFFDECVYSEPVLANDRFLATQKLQAAAEEEKAVISLPYAASRHLPERWLTKRTCETRHSFSQLFLCLSRACLCKTTVFTFK